MIGPHPLRTTLRRAAFIALPAIMVALTGCGPGTVSDGGVASGEPTPGGTAVVGVRTEFGGFNPITNNDQYTDEVIKYALFTPIVRYNDQLEIEPYLAESWELQGDTGVVFNIRRGVTWHDGEPVTAEDIAFTFSLAKDPATASLIGTAFLPEVESAEVIDPYTIRFDFVRPHAQALEDFWWAPVPRHLLEGVPPTELRTAEFNRNPVGSGPYRFVEWRSNDRVVIERNPDFPEELGGAPHLDRVIFRVIPELATMLTELMTGGIQVDLPVSPSQASQIESARGLELFSFPSRTVYYLGWNNRRAPFDRPEIRQALAYAIDRDELIAGLLHGHGTLAMSPIPPLSPFNPVELEPAGYNLGRANSLLDDAGWARRNSAGIRVDQGGQPLTFTLMVSDDPLNRSVVEVVQAQLRKVGVDARIQVLEFQTLLSHHRGRDFDAVFHNWVLDNFQVAAAPAALFHSRWAATPGSANRSSYSNPRADTLLDAGASMTDPEAARRNWAEFVQLLQEEQPITFLFWKDELAATRDNLQGVEMDARGKLATIAGWWLVGGGAR